MRATPRRRSTALVLGTCLLALAGPASAQDAPAPEPLVVGTKQAAPFSFQDADGTWQGISIDLWRAVADDLGLAFELREVSLDGLVEGLADGSLDASVAALTVTPEREQRVDFTHPFHPSGLGIAVPTEGGGHVARALRGLLSTRFFEAVGTLVVVIFLAGAVLWLLERKRNAEQFGGTVGQGLGSAFWWSAVTMTTVGYGDKAPTTVPGRLVAVVWMFASVITISGLTAAVASTLTVSRLATSVSGPRDLPGLGRIGCVRDSTGQAYLTGERLPYTAFPSADGALEALADGRVRAVVYDAPILRYLASTSFPEELTVLPSTFERQDYAIALPLGSELRKPINAALLARTSGEGWSDTLYEYLGSEP